LRSKNPISLIFIDFMVFCFYAQKYIMIRITGMTLMTLAPLMIFALRRRFRKRSTSLRWRHLNGYGEWSNAEERVASRHPVAV